MKYAIISDIHGNLDALSAVLKDAETFRVDRYIFAGDYFASLPYPNEVIDLIKNFKNAVVVQGNEENHFSEYENQNQSLWTDGQFQTTYWCFKTITNVNRNYLSTLPKTLIVADGDINITITHSSSDIIGNIEHQEFSSLKVAIKYQNDDRFSKEKLSNDIRAYLKRDEFLTVFDSLADGVYIWGHTHIQWNIQLGNKIFINPGSCGIPLDGTSGAPYTLLDVENNQARITERRVAYDTEKLVHNFRGSSLYEAAPVWSNIIIRELTTQFEHVMFFLQFANEYADKIHDPIRPFSVKTWTEAYHHWRSV